ncbi:MAG: hypothetical protein J3K34DRAFT_426216 [Monoraphidium minutum]|nr:MAG: hypothetical protein J3K34DRAFT_426216 [Monoraphidium minutum]
MVFSAEDRGGGALLLAPQGWLLPLDDPLVRAVPGWADQLTKDRAARQLPDAPVELRGAAAATSAAALWGAVQRDPAVWCCRAAPDAPLPSGLEYETLAAGELMALMQGARGVAMVQLHLSWDKGAPQPVHNPLALGALRRALADPDITGLASPAPGGLGLTLLLAARQEPFRAWAAHLAGFGAQAGVVAESPYYKLLIGRALGYSEDNIMAHIKATNGRGHPSPEVVAAVEQQLRELSARPPRLPWRKAGGGGGKKRR